MCVLLNFIDWDWISEPLDLLPGASSVHLDVWTFIRFAICQAPEVKKYHEILREVVPVDTSAAIYPRDLKDIFGC